MSLTVETRTLKEETDSRQHMNEAILAQFDVKMFKAPPFSCSFTNYMGYPVHCTKSKKTEGILFLSTI